MPQRPKKLGKFTILQVQQSACELVYICRCQCGQICLLSSSQVRRKSKLSCDKCLKPDYKFAVNEIAVVEHNLFSIKKGEQVIVTAVCRNEVKVEYQGKIFTGKSNYFRSLGLKF